MAAKKAPAKKTATRKTDAEVTPTRVETLEPGQRVRWSKADLLKPREADDEEHWWPVPEGIWREVNSIASETTEHGQVVIVEYAPSSHTDDDFDERAYRPGTVLGTKPATYRTHKIGGALKVGDRIRIGSEVWIVHADGLEQS